VRIRDTTLSMVGVFSYYFQGTVLGSFLTENGYYASIPLGSLGGLTSVGIRAHMSKIVPLDELGKVFSLVREKKV
jgi:hypothetical protein